MRKLDALHNRECLCANKSMRRAEPRVPFLNREFLDVAMRFDAAHKMVGSGFGGRRIEKAVLREAPSAHRSSDSRRRRCTRPYSLVAAADWFERIQRVSKRRKPYRYFRNQLRVLG